MLFIETAEPGGAEEVVCQLARGLTERGDQALVVTLEDGWLTQSLTDASPPCVRLDSRRRLDVGLIVRIVRLIRERGIELLHSHLLDSAFYGSIAARCSRIPHLATDHGDVHLPQPKRFVRTKLRVAARLGTRFTAVSGFTARRLEELGVPAARISLLPNPVASPVATDGQERARVRAELGVAEDRERHWIWFHAGMLRPVKDQETLIRGFSACRQLSGTRQSLFLAGDGPERPRLEALARECGVADEVVFLGFRNDLRRLLVGADGFVLSSLSEAMPMSLLEAGSAGLVLVGTRVGGIPEVIDDPRTGRLFEPRDHTGLGAVLADLLRDPEASQAMASRARATIQERFSSESVLEAYAEMCRGLIGSRS